MSSKALQNFLDAKAQQGSFRTLEANTELVESTLGKVASTNEVIDRLVEAGKGFDYVTAKADLLDVIEQVTKIAEEADLASEWVSADLEALHKRASTLRDLFPKD